MYLVWPAGDFSDRPHEACSITVSPAFTPSLRKSFASCSLEYITSPGGAIWSRCLT